MKPLIEILEKKVPQKYFVSDHIRKKRLEKQKPTKEITIWHENKAGNISAYPFSCALRAGASYNYLLVNGERRLTSREMLRLQGFPEEFKIISSYTQTRKQVGNSLPVPVAQAVIRKAIQVNGCLPKFSQCEAYIRTNDGQHRLIKKGIEYERISKTSDGRKIQTSLSPK
jgi:DNA (cytosine-5)-methyltransferase 1